MGVCTTKKTNEQIRADKEAAQAPKEYIDRELLEFKFERMLKRYESKDGGYLSREDIFTIIENAAIKSMAERTCMFLKNKYPRSDYRCSECGERIIMRSNYCPGCGARVVKIEEPKHKKRTINAMDL